MKSIASALLLLVGVAHAGAPIDLQFMHLSFKRGVVFTEGGRSLGDAFPYVAVGHTALTPKTLADFIETIPSGDAAIEAVRLFVARLERP